MAVSKSNGLGGGGRERALVVHSDRSAADSAVEVLREMGYAVHVARDGGEALATMSRTPGLVLIESSPAGGGVADFLKRMKRLRGMSDVPVLGAVGRRPPSDVVRSTLMDAGVDAFLPRPFAPADVAAALTEARSGPVLPEFRPITRPGRAISQQNAAKVTPPSSRTMTAVIAGKLLFSGGEVECIVERASSAELTVRYRGRGPSISEAVRLVVQFRGAIADAMHELPLRVVGSIRAAETVSDGTRVRVGIGVAAPTENLQRLMKELRR